MITFDKAKAIIIAKRNEVIKEMNSLCPSDDAHKLRELQILDSQYSIAVGLLSKADK